MEHVSWVYMQEKAALPCRACRGKGFYICKLCNGNATIAWSPMFDPIAINPCVCPTCEGNRFVFPLFCFILCLVRYSMRISKMGYACRENVRCVSCGFPRSYYMNSNDDKHVDYNRENYQIVRDITKISSSNFFFHISQSFFFGHNFFYG